MDRGEREGFLKVSVTVDAARAVRLLTERTVKNDSPSARRLRAAAEDAYVRLIHPSLEREVRAGLTERACEGAISVFSKNLRQLLLQPPIKGKVAIGLDPGYLHGLQNGCGGRHGQGAGHRRHLPRFRNLSAWKKRSVR